MRLKKRIKRVGEVALVESLVGLARILPGNAGRAVFGTFAGWAGRAFKRDFQRAVDNLGLAFPDFPAPFRQALALATFKSVGRNAYEFLRLMRMTREQVLERVERVEGLEYFVDAHARGRGVIVVTGHVGCWELMPAYFTALGYPINVIARRMKSARLNQRLVDARQRLGVTSVDRDDNPRPLFEMLRRGEVLGILIDQHTQVAGIWVPFFGRPAYTPTAVAKIALATGAPIVPMAMFLNANGRHTVRVLPPIDTETDASRADRIADITARASLAVERLIRIDPRQWVWFHHRWRDPAPASQTGAAYVAEG